MLFRSALFSVLLLVLGLVLKNQSDFAQSYVKDQLGAQQIYFQPTASLGDEMKTTACLVEYGQGGPADHGGGQLLSTGKMAECYANKYIAAHMAGAAKGAGYDGATYATMGKFTMKGSGAADSVSLVDQLAAAKTGGDQTKIDAAQAALDKATGLRGTLLTGETLRGLLLTSYGFSIFGDKADLAATVCGSIAGIFMDGLSLIAAPLVCQVTAAAIRYRGRSCRTWRTRS